jgi:hypothetical protein
LALASGAKAEDILAAFGHSTEDKVKNGFVEWTKRIENRYLLN